MAIAERRRASSCAVDGADGAPKPKPKPASQSRSQKNRVDNGDLQKYD